MDETFGGADQLVLSHSTYSAVLISLIATVSAALAVACYHLILIVFCRRHTRPSLLPSPSSSSSFAVLRYRQGGAAAGTATRDGLDDRALNSIPALQYSDRAREFFKIDGAECVVCLAGLQKGERVRWLPGCAHAFHVACVDGWLRSHASCPTCRAHVVAPARLTREEPCGPREMRRTRSGGVLKTAGPTVGEDEEVVGTGLKRSRSVDHCCAVSVDLEMGESRRNRDWNFLVSSPGNLPASVDWRSTLTRSIFGFDSLNGPNSISRS